MKTIALRFSDNFAPDGGTIAAHRECIDTLGYVWYGKLGSAVSDKICKEVMANEEPRILLIHSGRQSRYWAYVDMVSKDVPSPEGIPEYYRNQAELFHTWFRLWKIEKAERAVMTMCTVVSSGTALSVASRHSMSPYFIIKCEENGDRNESI